MEESKPTRKKVKKPIPTIGLEPKQELSINDKAIRIAVSAYLKAEARGYEPGHEIQDWLEAEAEHG
jgi:hypothetical protein